MKRSIALVIVGALCIGCAAKQTTVSPDYAQYLATVQATTHPLVEITWDETGQRMTSLKVTQPVNIQQKAPDAPHPAWGVANSLIRTAGIVGGIWAAGDAMQGVIEASRGTYNTTTSDSYNTTSNTSTSTSTSNMANMASYHSSSSSSGGESGSGTPGTVNINRTSGGNSYTNNSNQGNTNNSNNDSSNHDNPVDNSVNTSNSNNPDNSTNNSNNPIDNSNQGNPITYPVSP